MTPKLIGLVFLMLFLNASCEKKEDEPKTSRSNVVVAEFVTTSGELALSNLESELAETRKMYRSTASESTRVTWAEKSVALIKTKLRFLSTYSSIDELLALSEQLNKNYPEDPQAMVIRADIYALIHKFSDASILLTEASVRAASPDLIMDKRAVIDLATGEAKVQDQLALRARQVSEYPGWEKHLQYANVLMEAGETKEADVQFRLALSTYKDAYPFVVSWIYFQIGVLWGERTEVPDIEKARQAYELAILHLPAYVQARVHLSEVYMQRGEPLQALKVLEVVAHSDEPEVSFLLEKVYKALGDEAKSIEYYNKAKAQYQTLLTKYPLAFADHATEFYIYHNDPNALKFAQLNLDNRKTLRAYDLFLRAAKDRLMLRSLCAIWQEGALKFRERLVKPDGC